MNDPLALVLDRLRAAGCDPRPTSSGHGARCPAHEDHSPSLSIGTGDDGRALVHCHAGCSHEAIVAALDLRASDLFPADGARPAPRAKKPAPAGRSFPTVEALVADIARGRPVAKVWHYHDRDGAVVGAVVRIDEADGKMIRPAARMPDGSWVMKAMPAPRPLYRLPAVLSSAGPIWVCEGEKAADAIVGIGLEATTSPGGAQAARHADWSVLAGRAVVVVPDYDEAGEGYRRDVEQLARDAGATSVLVVRLVDLWPDLPAGGDAHDWIEAHDAIKPDALRDRLVRAAAEAADKVVIEAAPAVASATTTTTATATTSATPAAVARLVSLSDAIERWRKQERPPVVETGFTPLDDAGGGGLPVGGLTVFAGAPGVGKSALALQATLGALRVDPTLRATWAAGEMTVEGIAQRAVVNWAAGPADRRVSMAGAANRTNAALAVATNLETAIGDRLQLLPAPLPVEDIIDAVTATGSKLLVVDFLQLVEVAGATDRRHEVDAVVRALRTVALDQGVAVVLLSNIAKNVGGDARAGVVGKESSEVDFAADLLFLGVDGEPDGDARERPVRWRCLKNRNGERRDLETTFNGSRQWFDHEATVEPHHEFADFAPAGGKAR
jgi:replicative DNA helicase